MLEHGRRGQFDISVDGEVVVSRKGGLFAKLTRRPWPDPDEVTAAVHRATELATG